MNGGGTLKQAISFLIMGGVLLLALIGCSNSAKEAYDTVQIKEVPALMEAGKTVLDVREVEEFEEGHIIGAVNKPLSELQKESFDGLDKETAYVVICRSGNRSVTASDILSKAGYSITNVSEGMSSWTGPIE